MYSTDDVLRIASLEETAVKSAAGVSTTQFDHPPLTLKDLESSATIDTYLHSTMELYMTQVGNIFNDLSEEFADHIIKYYGSAPDEHPNADPKYKQYAMTDADVSKFILHIIRNYSIETTVNLVSTTSPALTRDVLCQSIHVTVCFAIPVIEREGFFTCQEFADCDNWCNERHQHRQDGLTQSLTAYRFPHKLVTDLTEAQQIAGLELMYRRIVSRYASAFTRVLCANCAYFAPRVRVRVCVSLARRCVYSPYTTHSTHTHTHTHTTQHTPKNAKYTHVQPRMSMSTD